ncbi:MAG: hypothetical protein ACK52W_08775 [Alphaproteobacteria bacterium]
MSNPSRGKYGLFIGLFLILAVLAFYVLNAPDRRNAGEKIGDAVEALPDGAEKAARQLESRTPGEKLDDTASDAGEDLRKAINQQ